MYYLISLNMYNISVKIEEQITLNFSIRKQFECHKIKIDVINSFKSYIFKDISNKKLIDKIEKRIKERELLVSHIRKLSSSHSSLLE